LNTRWPSIYPASPSHERAIIMLYKLPFAAVAYATVLLLGYRKCSHPPSCPRLLTTHERHTHELPIAHCPVTRFEMLVYITSRLDSAEIPYMLTYGTLLGAVRDHSIIPWTEDVDVLLPFMADDVPRIQKFCAVDPCMTFSKFVIDSTRTTGTTSQGLCSERSGWWFSPTTLDLYPMNLVKPDTYRIEGSDWTYLRTEMFPPSAVVVNGREFAAPAHPEIQLERVFGSSWHVPQRGVWSQAMEGDVGIFGISLVGHRYWDIIGAALWGAALLPLVLLVAAAICSIARTSTKLRSAADASASPGDELRSRDRSLLRAEVCPCLFMDRGILRLQWLRTMSDQLCAAIASCGSRDTEGAFAARKRPQAR